MKGGKKWYDSPLGDFLFAMAFLVLLIVVSSIGANANSPW